MQKIIHYVSSTPRLGDLSSKLSSMIGRGGSVLLYYWGSLRSKLPGFSVKLYKDFATVQLYTSITGSRKCMCRIRMWRISFWPRSKEGLIVSEPCFLTFLIGGKLSEIVLKHIGRIRPSSKMSYSKSLCAIPLCQISIGPTLCCCTIS